jgi:hypothetical protein
MLDELRFSLGESECPFAERKATRERANASSLADSSGVLSRSENKIDGEAEMTKPGT